VLLWDDMVNPDHNGGQVEYQWWDGGGRPQTSDGAVLGRLIDPGVLWHSWAYCADVDPDPPPPPGVGFVSDTRKVSNAPRLFQDHGYDWVGGPWVPTTNIVLFGKALQAAKRAGKNGLGLVDVNYVYPPNPDVTHWANIPAVASCVWNLEAFLADPKPVRNVTGC
jgi:hypothetical protein